MTAEELVEAVARAMKADADGRDDWDTTPDEALKIAWLSSARAALRVVREAMEEPDSAMLDGAMAAYRANAKEPRIRPTMPEIWRAMLAASPIGRIDA